MFFSNFPYGWSGVGLVLLRLAVGLSGVVDGFCIAGIRPDSGPAQWVPAAMEIFLGAILVAGFLTPAAAILATIRTLYIGLPLLAMQDRAVHESAFAFLYLSVISVALLLLGPGGFSVDARLFGRREIIIPKMHDRE